MSCCENFLSKLFVFVSFLRKLVCKSPSPPCSSLPAPPSSDSLQTLNATLCIIGNGPAAHTAAIYAARAQLNPIVFEGCIPNDVSPTSDVDNFPGFPSGILAMELSERCRNQSIRFGAHIITETVAKVDFSTRPFKVFTDLKLVLVDSVIVATGAIPKRLTFPGSGSGPGGFWNCGISACALNDGAAPIFRNRPLAVIGGGDSAMEQSIFLTKYASKVYIIHRRDSFKASRIMQRRALSNRKIEVVWSSVVVEAYGNHERGVLEGLKVRNLVNGEVSTVDVSGLFFAVGQEPATEFLNGQLQLNSDGYILTRPGTTLTNVAGVFAAGDVQDNKYRQAVTAAATGCMAALDALHYLQDKLIYTS